MSVVRTKTNIRALVDAIDTDKSRPVTYRFSNGREFKQRTKSWHDIPTVWDDTRIWNDSDSWVG